MKEIEYIFFAQSVLCVIIMIIVVFIYIFSNKDMNENRLIFTLCVAIYCFICLAIAYKAKYERSVEEINAYKEYYKDTENMIDAIWELEPDMVDKIDMTKYNESRKKTYKLMNR